MRYVRTKNRIVDLEKFINEEKDTPYYKDFEFEEISKDGKLKWTAIGTEKCSIKNQIGRRCHFSATLNSEIIKQGETIEELCDVIVCRNELFYPLTSNREDNEFDWEEIDRFRKTIVMSEEGYNKIKETSNDFEPYFWKVYGSIWTDKGLIYVAKMNEKGELELL